MTVQPLSAQGQNDMNLLKGALQAMEQRNPSMAPAWESDAARMARAGREADVFSAVKLGPSTSPTGKESKGIWNSTKGFFSKAGKAVANFMWHSRNAYTRVLTIGGALVAAGVAAWGATKVFGAEKEGNY